MPRRVMLASVRLQPGPAPDPATMTLAQLDAGARERYRHELFAKELDAVLDHPDVAGELTRTKLSRAFVHASCLREEAALRAPVEDDLGAVDAALSNLAKARTQRSGLMVFAHPLAFVPGLGRFLFCLAMVGCAVAFLLGTPGPHGAVGRDQLILLAGACAAAAAGGAVVQMTRMGGGVRLFLAQAVLLGAAPVLLAAGTLTVTSVHNRQPVTASLTLGVTAICAALGCAEFFRPRPDVEPKLAAARVGPLSAGGLATLVVLLLVTTAVIVLLLVLGTGATPRRLDTVRPDKLVLTVAATVAVVTWLLAVAGRGAVRLSAARSELETVELVARRLLRRAALLPHIRHMIDGAQPSYRDVLVVTRPAGLSQSFDPIYEVPTEAIERVRTTLSAMPGGSIGIAGPRGVGKSTLIASVCGHGLADQRNALRVNVSAPVEYAPRDFLLHLYAQVCRAVIERAGGRSSAPDPLSGAGNRRTSFALYTLAVIVAGAAAILLIVTASGVPMSIPQLAAVLLLLLAIGFAVQGWQRRPPAATSDEPRSLHELALSRLHEIEYQQSISGEWAGGVKMLPVGIDVSMKHGHGFVRQPKSLPDIVDSLREFLRTAAASAPEDAGRRDPVIVGIDELDKIETDDRARQFLSDIKSVFGVPGCQFLVSVSEDAMASFERRGLPFRDVFDSAFDEIIRLQYLTFEEASDLISRRTTEFPVPFKGLSFCLSGGLPRDLIRAARGLVEYATAGEVGLAAAARRLVGLDLAGKAAAVSSATRKVDAEPATSGLLTWCNRIAESATNTTALRDAVHALRRIDVRWADTVEEAHLAALRRLAREIAGYAYYANTLLEFFQPAGESRWREAAKPGGRGFDTLARARRDLSANPIVGWASVTGFRRAWGIADLEIPRTLVGRADLTTAARALAQRIAPGPGNRRPTT